MDSLFFLITGSNGIIFVIAGIILYKFPPKKINHLYGYRTYASMQSQERWDFAQIFSAKKLIQGGVIMLLSALLVFFFPMDESIEVVIGLLIVISTVFYLIFT